MDIACIGGGGQGYWDILAVGKRDDIVAIADVDFGMAYKAFKAFPKAKQYKDFRKMLEEMDGRVDAVTVSIPDHQHAVAAMMAMRMGKHVYVQKPLAHDIWEVRQLVEAARKYGVVTQMGNHGTANNRFREAVEVVWSGAIGQVREVHVWSDRPFWPTGIQRPERHSPIPPTLDWGLWLGTARERPYHRAYHPVKWRAWYDFGTGTLGDMGCHGLNLPFMALRLGERMPMTAEEGQAPSAQSTRGAAARQKEPDPVLPIVVAPEFSGDINEDTYPTWSVVRYEFPACGDLPPVKVTWYDGGTRMPTTTKETIAGLMNAAMESAIGVQAAGGARTYHRDTPGGSLNESPGSPSEAKSPDEPLNPPNGALLIGDQGTLFSPDEYGWSYRLLPKERFKDYKAPTPMLPRVTGEHHAEWVNACKGEAKTLSSFDHAGPLTEMVLLGSLAICVRERIEWDVANMRVTSLPKANDHLRRDYRKGWSF